MADLTIHVNSDHVDTEEIANGYARQIAEALDEDATFDVKLVDNVVGAGLTVARWTNREGV